MNKEFKMKMKNENVHHNAMYYQYLYLDIEGAVGGQSGTVCS